MRRVCEYENATTPVIRRSPWSLLSACARRDFGRPLASAEENPEAGSIPGSSRGCPGRAHVQGGTVLAEALAQSVEHAAGDRPLCGRKERPHLVLESWSGSRWRRNRRG